MEEITSTEKSEQAVGDGEDGEDEIDRGRSILSGWTNADSG